MKLFEVLQPLMESQARIEKTTEKYALNLAIVSLKHDIHTHLLDDLEATIFGIADKIGGEVFDSIQGNRSTVEYHSAIEEIFESKYGNEVVNELEKIVSVIAEKFDPTPNNKYLDWIVRIYSRVGPHIYKLPDFRLEDDELINDVLTAFHQHKKHLEKKDINQYKSFTELKQAVDPFMGEIEDEKKQEMIGSGQAKVIYEENNERIIIPKTLDAAKAFSKGTEWCTQYPRMFEEYTSQGPLYIIDTPDPDNRIQVHFETDQMMDVDDKQIQLSDPDETMGSDALDWLIDQIKEEVSEGNADPDRVLFLLKRGFIIFAEFARILITMETDRSVSGIMLSALQYDDPEDEETKELVIDVFKSESNLAVGFRGLSLATESENLLDIHEYVKITNEFIQSSSGGQSSFTIMKQFTDTVIKLEERNRVSPIDAMDAFKNSDLTNQMKVKGITLLLQTILRTTSPVDPNDDSPIAPDWYVELVKQEGPISLSNKRILGILTDSQFIEALNGLPDSNEKQEAIDQFIRGRSEEEQQGILRKLGHES